MKTVRSINNKMEGDVSYIKFIYLNILLMSHFPFTEHLLSTRHYVVYYNIDKTTREKSE